MTDAIVHADKISKIFALSVSTDLRFGYRTKCPCNINCSSSSDVDREEELQGTAVATFFNESTSGRRF